MLSPDVREKIKSHLGSHYVKLIKEKLNELGIKNNAGKSYQTASISHVMNQRRSIPAIETVLMEFYNEIISTENKAS